MKRVKTEPIESTKTPKHEIDTPMADAFRKAGLYTNPLLKVELMRKRRRVKGTVKNNG